MDGDDLRCALRELFEVQVMNHGDYSLVYVQPCEPGPAMALGYRRTPLELVLCPVEAGSLHHTGGDGHRASARLAAPATRLDFTNVATVEDTGTGYRVQTVIGFRTWFEVVGAPRIPVGAASGDGTVILDQGEDAKDFHRFMGHFMGLLDAFYKAPDTIPSLSTLMANARP